MRVRDSIEFHLVFFSVLRKSRHTEASCGMAAEWALLHSNNRLLRTNQMFKMKKQKGKGEGGESQRLPELKKYLLSDGWLDCKHLGGRGTNHGSILHCRVYICRKPLTRKWIFPPPPLSRAWPAIDQEVWSIQWTLSDCLCGDLPNHTFP